jgi:hypothetical protein
MPQASGVGLPLHRRTAQDLIDLLDAVGSLDLFARLGIQNVQSLQWAAHV